MRPIEVLQTSPDKLIEILIDAKTAPQIVGVTGSVSTVLKTRKDVIKAASNWKNEIIVINKSYTDGTLNVIKNIFRYVDLSTKSGPFRERAILGSNFRGSAPNRFTMQSPLGKSKAFRILKPSCLVLGITGTGTRDSMTTNRLRRTVAIVRLNQGFNDCSVTSRTDHNCSETLWKYKHLGGHARKWQQGAIFRGCNVAEEKRLCVATKPEGKAIAPTGIATETEDNVEVR